MSDIKPWLSFDEQLATLHNRGMIIDDYARARRYLQHVGYYRLSGYWYAFRQREGKVVTDAFKPSASFNNAIDLYVFDQRLRTLVFEALERIEISIRVEVSHTLGKLDPLGHLNPKLFDSSFSQVIDRGRYVTKHHEWVSKNARLVSRSKEDFVKHNRKKYGLPLTVWVASEVWDFGALSTLYGGMRTAEQYKIAKSYHVNNGRVLATWLRSFNYLRNICAHYARLWNRNIVDQPSLEVAEHLPWIKQLSRVQSRCFLLLCLCLHMMRVISPKATWPHRLKEHLKTFPDLQHLGLNLRGMGAWEGWEQLWDRVGR